VGVPWGAWYADTVKRFAFPPSWRVDLLAPKDAPAWDAERIESALETPIESPPLVGLASGSRSACVVVDDLARPTQAADVLPTLLGQLKQGGIDPAATTIVVATGAHGPMDDRQIAWKVGAETAAAYRVEVHDATAELAPSGIQYGRQELMLNRTFLEADVRVGVGAVLPHSFAAYSGGAKLVLPGLADVQATVRSHKFVRMGLRGGRNAGENGFRREIEQLARQIGFRYIVCIVPNSRRETAGVFAGDVVAAHRAACSHAEKTYATPLQKTYDCMVLNAYPKDIDLVQSENVMVSLKHVAPSPVREGGVLVVATAASEGIGRHGLFAPGGASYRPPTPKRFLGDRELWLFAPGVTEAESRTLYSKGYPFFRNSKALSVALRGRFPRRARAAVMPCAAMQQLKDKRKQP